MRPRSLADQLRAFTDDQLHILLSGRLDLAYPIASDVTALAARATTAPSVARCLEQRNALELCVLAHACTLSANQPVALTVIAGAAGRGVEDQELHLAIESAIRVLRDLALLWGDDDHLRAIAAAHELAFLRGNEYCLAIKPGAAYRDAIVKSSRHAELGQMRAHHPHRRRQPFLEAARVEEHGQACARRAFTEADVHASSAAAWLSRRLTTAGVAPIS